MTVLKIEGQMVQVSVPGVGEMWIPKECLRQYGVKASEIKIGRTLNPVSK